MAEKEAPAVHESIRLPNPLSSIISKFTDLVNFRFPPPPPPVKVEIETKAAGNAIFGGGEVAEESKPMTVRFPDAQPTTVAPLKLEAEEVKDTNPVLLWQVYAIGGFFVLRWVLARWNERSANKSSADEDSPPPPPPPPEAAAEGNE